MITTIGYMSSMTIMNEAIGVRPERRYKVRAFDCDGDQMYRIRDGVCLLVDLTEERYVDAQDINERLVPIIAQRNQNSAWPIVRLEAYIEREENVASLDLTVTQPTRVATTQAGEWKRLV